MSTSPTFPGFILPSLNAGGAGDAGRYTLDRLLSLAGSLARGIAPGCPSIVRVEREGTYIQGADILRAAIGQTTTAKGKPRLLRLEVPDAEAETGVRIHTVEAQTVVDALTGIKDEAGTHAIVDGNSRTLACILLWAMGLPIPTLPLTDLDPETSDDDLRLVSAQGNETVRWARIMAYQGRVLLALAMTDPTKPDACAREADVIRKASVGRGIGQLMFRAASAIRKHGLKPDADGNYPKLDKEAWAKVLALAPGDAGVAEAIKGNTTAPARTVTLPYLLDRAKVAPAGIGGDVLRAIAADDLPALVRLVFPNAPTT